MPKAQGDRKVCSACRADLPLSGFDHNRAAADGLNNQCKSCARASRRKHAAKDPARFRRIQMESMRRHRYGVSAAEYEAVVAAVDGRCPVCGSPPKAPYSCLEIDHDHETGRVRGPLCHNCNRALGHAQDNPEVLRALASYVEAHRGLPPRPPLAHVPRYAKGEVHPKAKLTETQVREIRALAEAGTKQAEIGARFGVTQETVSMIAHHQTWKHVE